MAFCLSYVYMNYRYFDALSLSEYYIFILIYMLWKLRNCLQKVMSETANSILEKTWNELDDEVSKCEDRIQKKYEILQTRLADDEARGRWIMEEISRMEVKW